MKTTMTLKAICGISAVNVLLAAQAIAAPIVFDDFDTSDNDWTSSFGNVSGPTVSGNQLTWTSSFSGGPLAEVSTAPAGAASELVQSANSDWAGLGAMSLSFNFWSSAPAGTILEIYFSETGDSGNWRYQFTTAANTHYQTDLDFNFGTGWYYDAAGPYSEGDFTDALQSVDLVGISISGITLDTIFTLDNVTLDNAPTGGVGVSYVPEPGTYAALAMIFICLATGFRDQLREGFAKLSLARSSGTPA